MRNQNNNPQQESLKEQIVITDDFKYFISDNLIFAPEQHAEITCKLSLSLAIILAKYFFTIS